MALPKGAAAALGADMASKGMGAGSMPAPEGDDPAKPDVMHQIAGDVIDAIQSGSKEDAAKFLVELVERMTSDGPGEGDEEDEEEPEAAQ